jgi:putative ABC transport system permease protein
MSLFNVLRVAFRAIGSNKLRTFLTMLGVIIGVTAVIMMVSISTGTEATIAENINSLGANLIFISPSAASFSGARGPRSTLVYTDVGAIQDNITEITGVSVEQQTRQTVKVGLTALDGETILGTTIGFPSVRGMTIADGDFFTQAQTDSKAKVAVLGSTVATDLFGTAEPVGQYIIVGNNVRLTVIGVFAEKGSVGGVDFDSRIYIPITVLFQYFQNNQFARLTGDSVNLIYVAAKDQTVINDVVGQINTLLAERHNVSPDAPDFTIRTQQDIISAQESTTASFRTLLAGVAGVSLLVGGIGIMNIMLVSVTERTREIGIRQAVGATPADVRWQFLTEALILSLSGGIIGILTGIAGSYLFGRLGNIRTLVSIESILLAFVAAAAVGILFGFLPANRAAGLDPIVALRHE